MKRVVKWVLYGVGIVGLFILTTNVWVVLSTRDQVISQPKTGRSYPIAVVLGTSRLTIEGEKNPFFEERMNAASQLYFNGNVSQLLVSGDNESRYYNEPRDMAKALVDRGVPDSVIQRDASGLRTLDSMIRLRDVYGYDTVLVVTQEFHAYRALFIANHNGLIAKAFPAVSPQDRGVAVYVRELIARPLAVIDLFILHRQPKYPQESNTSL